VGAVGNRASVGPVSQGPVDGGVRLPPSKGLLAARPFAPSMAPAGPAASTGLGWGGAGGGNQPASAVRPDAAEPVCGLGLSRELLRA